MARIDTFLKLAAEQKASDFHLIAGSPPMIRVNGDLFHLKFRQISQSDCNNFIEEILTSDLKKKLEEKFEIDFSYTVKGASRFRVNVFTHKDGLSAVFRIIPDRISTLQELNLPHSIKEFANFEKGLILITGPTGCGKSTTLAAIIDIINSEKRRHILTIEEPIEFIHKKKKSLVSQREVGLHTPNFETALRSAARGAADVILVGEMRNPETISLSLTCAETGSLILGTLHTDSTASAISRLIDSFPPDRQSQVRAMLAMSLKGVIAQQLVKKSGGRMRLPAVEVLFGSSALANVIREGKLHQIASQLETAGSSKNKMISMDQSLLRYVKQKQISPETALYHAYNRPRMKKILEALSI